MPQPPGPQVQVFGRKDSRGTQKAQRFFKERRVDVQTVDLKVKPMAPGEISNAMARMMPTAFSDATMASASRTSRP